MSVSEAGALHIRGGGIEMDTDWPRLTIRDWKSLALAVLREGNPADDCLVAFYLLAAGEEEEAEEHLLKAGEAAEEVRAHFE